MGELGELVEGVEDGVFCLAHFFSVGVVAVVEADEVEPSVGEIEGEFSGEGEVEFGGAGAGVVDGDDDFPGGFHIGCGGEGDDVGGAGVIHEFGMDSGDGRVVDKDDGEFAGLEGELGEGLDATGEALGGLQGVAEGGVAVADGEFHIRVWEWLRERFRIRRRLWSRILSQFRPWGTRRANEAC